MGGDQPGRQYRRCHRRKLRLAVLRGHRAPERLRRGKPADLRGAVPGERGGYCSDVHLQSQRQRSVGRRLSDRWLFDGRHRVLSRIWWNVSRRRTGVDSSSRTTPGTASGGWPRVPTASRIPPRELSSSALPRGPSTWKWAQTAPCTTSGSTEPSAASSSRQGTSHRPPSPRLRLRAGPAPLTVSFDGRSSTRS